MGVSRRDRGTRGRATSLRRSAPIGGLATFWASALGITLGCSSGGDDTPAGSGSDVPGVSPAGTVPFAPGTDPNANGVPPSATTSMAPGDPTMNPVVGGAPTAPPATTGPAVSAVPGVRAPLAARISKTEYAWSVWDVLQVELTEEDLAADNGGLPDDAGDGVFKRFADKQVTVEQHAAGLWTLAERVASRVSVDFLRTSYGACAQPTVECVQPLLSSIGERLFRRPLDERDLTTYRAVSQAAIDAEEPFDQVVRWTLMALLQAPAFVFHLQNETQGTAGSPRDLTPYELSARLASFIWSSVPDAALLAAAKDGSLHEPAAFDAQVQRMLEDPKAQRMTEAFIRDYSRAERASFLDATDADRQALRESIVATFQYLTWEAKRPLGELFTTTDYVVNPRTAELLGLDNPGPGLSHVDVSSLPERVGLLTHPGVIAGMGDQEIGSFVNRGKFLMERLLCLHPTAVPAALAGALEEFTADTTGLSEHERLALRKTRAECWGCHAQFEPFAIGFARFDGAGRYRGEVDEQGRPLPLDGWVPLATEADSPRYSDVRQYMTILQDESAIQTCLTEHFLSFGTSYSPDSMSRGTAAQMARQAIAGEQDLVQMVSAVAHTELFRQFIVQAASEGVN